MSGAAQSDRITEAMVQALLVLDVSNGDLKTFLGILGGV
jgi:hypothetical protein